MRKSLDFRKHISSTKPPNMIGRFLLILATFATLTFAVPFPDSNDASQIHNVSEGIADCPKMVTRDEWGAKDPTCFESLTRPAKHVVIHHTYIPPACNDLQNCSAAMRSMQKFHQVDRKWCDVGYNFAVGGDGLVFVGRGWGAVGAHAPPYNFESIGVALIGDYRNSLPNEEMLNAVKALIKCGINSGFIVTDYKLIGHRQAKTVTECPGTVLFQEIQKWPHWYDDWINPQPNPQIQLLDTNSKVQPSNGQEKTNAHYRVEGLRRRRHLG